MENNNSVYIEVEIETNRAIKDIAKLKEEQISLKQELKDLKETEGELSDAYIKKEAQLKTVNQQLANNQKQLQAVEMQQRESLGTIEKLTARNAELNAEKKKLDLTDEKNIKRLKEINDEMDKNNEELKSYGNQAQKQAANIGNYKSALEGLPPSLQGGIEGFKGMAAQAKAFLLNPIALTITAIVGALMLLYKSLTGTEEGQTKVNKIMGIFTGVLNGIMKVLRPLAEFLADYIIAYFETLGWVAEKALNLISDGLSALGFESASKAVKQFGDDMKETAKAAQELVDKENEFNKMQRDAERLQLDYQKRAEKLRQQRDDETKSISERVKINDELGKVLKEQAEAELTIARKGLEVAELRIKAEGESKENLDARAEALSRISDIEERITGQESEQLANLNALRKEGNAKLKEDAAKKNEISETQKKYELEQAKNLTDEKIKLLQIELEAYKEINKDKLSDSQTLNDNLVAEQKSMYDEIENKQREVLTKSYGLEIEAIEQEYNDKLISKDVYEAKKKSIDEQYRLDDLSLTSQTDEQKKAIDDRFLAQKIEAQSINYELQKMLLDESIASEFEAQMIDLQQKQDADNRFINDNIKDEAKRKEALKKLSEKYARAENQIQLAKYNAQAQLAQTFMGNIAQLAGENTKVGKAAAIAQTTVATIQSAVNAFNGMTIAVPGPGGIALGIVSAAAALKSGYDNVRKITEVKSGLPGDGSISAGGGLGASLPTATTSNISQQSQSINPELGQGIVSRDITDKLSTQQQQNIIVKPTLVIDDVTNKQMLETNINKTAIM